MNMASDFEKWVLEKTLTAEVADCLVYEARKKIEDTAFENDPYPSVYQAFDILGRVVAILADRFEEVKQELYKQARWRLLGPNFTEKVFEDAVERGLVLGWKYSLPPKMGLHSIHYGFVAQMVGVELTNQIRYVKGVGWEVWEDVAWYKRPKERGIVGLIYDVMKRKIKTWREFLADPRGAGGWLEMLEKNINDPDWLSKVEELLLRVDYFGVKIVSGDD